MHFARYCLPEFVQLLTQTLKENALNEAIPELSDNSAELNAAQGGAEFCTFSFANRIAGSFKNRTKSCLSFVLCMTQR